MPGTSPDRLGPENAVRYRQSTRVLVRQSMEALLLVGPSSAEPVVLTGTAPVLWDLLAQPASLAEIFRVLSERTGVPVALITTDFTPVLTGLIQARLIETVHAT
jgi:hypothetical protein